MKHTYAGRPARPLLTLLLIAALLTGCVALPADMTITVQTPAESAAPAPPSYLSRGFGVAGQTAFTEVAVDTNLVFEGATTDAYQTTLTVVDPTADRTITLPNSSGTVALNPAAGDIVFEGTTADDYETTLAVVDPTADRTITLPNETGAVIMSSLATNGTGITNSVTGGTNLLVWEGATADDYETSLSATDPTADRSIVLPNAAGTVMLSSLATNGADAANAVTGASNGLVFEGATANDYETTLTVTDPTADRTITLPNYGGTVLLSSTANEPDTANAVWANTGDLKWEGSSADAYETTLTLVNPTAARTITLPNATGTVALITGTTTLAMGSQTLTGSDPVTHSLTTPLYAVCTLGEDSVTAKHSCTMSISGATVTAKVWKADGTTASDAAALIYWIVGGTP